jgi:hypothetical protein
VVSRSAGGGAAESAPFLLRRAPAIGSSRGPCPGMALCGWHHRERQRAGEQPSTLLRKVRAWVWLEAVNRTLTVSWCLPGESRIDAT